MAKGLEILYEDNHILAVLKPAGVLVQGDRSGEITLFEAAKKYLKAKYRKPGQVYLGMVHRLDKGTAGVVVFARTSKAAGRLSREFRERRVRKVYMAVVEGRIRGEDVLTHRLLRDREKGTSCIARDTAPGTQEVKLSYRVIEGTGTRTLLEVIPETGRHHQIRAQLSAIGHPIIGDVRYGAGRGLAGGKIGLLASSISFRHPVKKNDMTIRVPLRSISFLKRLMQK